MTESATIWPPSILRGADYCNAIILQGVMARHLRRSTDDCRHGADTPERLLWLHGHDLQGRKKQSHVKQGRGKGRDWSDAELALLDIAGDLPRGELAKVLGRSEMAVRVKMSRRARGQAAEDRGQKGQRAED